MTTQRNVLECTDVYKLGHLLQYPEGTDYIYSYLQARTDKKLPETVFFGLQYYLTEYLAKRISHFDVDKLVQIHEVILGPVRPAMLDKLYALANLGYWPISIKAVPEGTVVPVQNVLMTITNTVPGFGWCVGFLESLLLKVWNTITVASYSLRLRRLVNAFAEATCDDFSHLPFQVHDFGYRGVSSEETAELAGAAHLLNFYGSDTVPAVRMLMKYYDAHFPIALSVPATEHSVMCSTGPGGEFDAFERLMFRTYPDGIVSIVSDTYDLWRVLTQYVPRLGRRILQRNGKVVFRPDSGDPVKVICGDPTAAPGTPQHRGALNILWDTFGGTVNSKGYRVLDPHVGLIYGDGFFFERFEEVLGQMKANGFASSNLVVGIGGLLLQAHTRDELGFAIKATFAVIDGEPVELFKDPVTDSKKRSHKGRLALHLEDGEWVTKQGVSESEEKNGHLVEVYRDGWIRKLQSLDEIRSRIDVSTGLRPLELVAA